MSLKMKKNSEEKKKAKPSFGAFFSTGGLAEYGE